MKILLFLELKKYSKSNYYDWYHRGTNILPDTDPNYIHIIATYFNQLKYYFFLSLKNAIVKISRLFVDKGSFYNFLFLFVRTYGIHRLIHNPFVPPKNES